MAGSSSHNSSMPASRSRRAALKTVLLGAAVAGATALRAAPAYAKKMSQKLAAYQDSPNKNGEACAACQYFQAPHSCQLVAGTISPQGWCQYWLKKSA